MAQNLLYSIRPGGAVCVQQLDMVVQFVIIASTVLLYAWILTGTNHLCHLFIKTCNTIHPWYGGFC